MKDSKKKKYYGLSKKQAQERLQQETFKRITLSFYKYVIIKDPSTLREQLFELWNANNCLGRIYIAEEGINAQMSIPEYYWENFKKELYAIPGLDNIPLKIAVHHGPSFYKLHIKVKKQIVADGLLITDYDIENVGKHLNAKQFNEYMDMPETLVVDMRNHYESEIGHFKGAITPKADTFRQELPMVVRSLKKDKNKKILLYCTGGIRCEKASAYLKHKGFTDVNQLHGGIIDYKHQVETQGLENKFLGSNYVFDARGAERIGKNIISHCHQCGTKCDTHVNCHNFTCNLLFIQCNSCTDTMKKTCSKKCLKVVSMPKQEKYYKKYSIYKQKKFSKSLKARNNIHKNSLWKKIIQRLHYS